MITQETIEKMKGELDKMKNNRTFNYADKYTLTDKGTIYNGLRDFYKNYAMGLTRDRETSSEMNQLTSGINKSKDKDDIISASRSLLGMYETVVIEAEHKLINETTGNILPSTPIHLKKGIKKEITLYKQVHLPSTEFRIESNLQTPPARVHIVFASNTGEQHIQTLTINANPLKDVLYSIELADRIPALFTVDVITMELLNNDELHIAFSITEYK